LPVASRRVEVEVRARVTNRSQAGNLLMTIHHQTVLTNNLTSEHRDPITGTPGYKSCAVRVSKA